MRSPALVLLAAFLLTGTGLGVGVHLITSMPGLSYSGPFRPLTPGELTVSSHLARHVQALAGGIGQRNLWHPGSLETTAAYLEEQFLNLGYKVEPQEFEAHGTMAVNLEVEITGSELPGEIVVVGAHYDTVLNSPGADDNGSGVAGLLEIGRLLAGRRYPRTIRLVAFANEEAPFFSSGGMGSLRYAERALRQEERITAMLSLETLGYYSDARLSQQYPFPFGLFYPEQGNFLAFVGNLGSRDLVRQSIDLFRQSTLFPSEGTAAPGWLTGIGWSDHSSFWAAGYPAIMLTDTAMFRYPYYHSPLDTPDKLAYDHLARVITGLSKVVKGLAGEDLQDLR